MTGAADRSGVLPHVVPVRMFGAPTFASGDGYAPLPPERRIQLLAFLACRGGWVTRDVCAALFWPDRPAAAARSNLRYLVLQLRRELPCGVFEQRGEAMRWRIDTDVAEFQRALRAHDWARATELYAGPLLEGFDDDAPRPYAEWLRFERARLAAAARAAARAYFDTLAGAPDRCAQAASRALALDPFDGAALAAYLRAQRALGDPAEGLRAFHQYARRLAADYGIEPASWLRGLAASLSLQGAAADHAEIGASTGLIGRSAERAQLRTWLAPGAARVVTITGAGGCGKSALARAAADELASRFAGGCHWIGLEDVSSAASVLPRIAAALGIEPRANSEAAIQVSQRLATANALLVLDGAERVAGIASVLVPLLQACPGVRLIVTSQTRLNLDGEETLALGGLPVPAATETRVDALRAAEAVQLFERCARAAAPDFDGAQHAAAIARLVRAVDGVPLAIELLASRVRVLTIDEMAREAATIEAAAGETPAERAVRACCALSWKLLAPAEQSAFAACSVFPSTFSLTAAEQVAGAASPVVASLVDKALLRAHADDRFSLHPALRPYAAPRLGDPQPVRRRHAEFFARLIGRHADFRATGAAVAIAEIEPELEHARAAWLHAVETNDASILTALAAPLGRCFEAKGRWSEGVELLKAALAVRDSPRAQAAVHTALAGLEYRRARFTTAEAHGRAGLAAAQRARDRTGIKAALAALGRSYAQRGMLAQARRCFDHGLQRARADEDHDDVALFAAWLAVVESRLGHATDAQVAATDALRAARTGAPAVVALQVLAACAEVLAQRGDARHAATLLHLVAAHPDTGLFERDDANARLTRLAATPVTVHVDAASIDAALADALAALASSPSDLKSTPTADTTT